MNNKLSPRLYRILQEYRFFNSPCPMPFDPGVGRRIAEAYEVMPDNPTAAPVQLAYRAFIQDTDAQFEHIRRAGIKLRLWSGDDEPYGSSREMWTDLEQNCHLWVFAGGNTHPILTADQNLRFRVVHDFTHAAFHFQFGPVGEENVWRVQCLLYSQEALPALASFWRETAKTRVGGGS